MTRAGLLLLSLLLATFACGQDSRRGPSRAWPRHRFRPAGHGAALKLADLIRDRGAVVVLADPRSDEGKRALAFLQQSRQRLQEMKVGPWPS